MKEQATRTDKAEDRAYLDDPPQPILKGKVPKLTESRRVDGVRFFAPAFPLNDQPTQILAVGISPTPEEAASILVTQHCEHFQKPRLLKGPLGQIIKDILDRFPTLQSDNLTYATAVPWLLPKTRRFRPNRDELEWCKPYLRDLVKHTKPQVIVAFGKLAFDQLVDFKISADDARGGWFDCEGIPVYLMDPAHLMVTQPWTLDTVITDFKEVDRMVQMRMGTLEAEEPVRHREIRTLEQLEALVQEWEAGNYELFSVDCEWKGANFVDGQLRSIQFAWTEHDCAYLNFFNEHGEPILGRTLQGELKELASNPEKFNSVPREELKEIAANSVGFNSDTEVTTIVATPAGKPAAVGEFYVDYKKVGKIIGRHLNRPEIRYIGHFTSADTTWMMKWLNLDVFGKFCFDSAFAMQTINEYAPLGLERLALQCTNFGRYDIPLVLWKKENPKLMQAASGYEAIPDGVLVPYACLRDRSMVQLGDGQWERISSLVNKRYAGEVRAVLDGKVVNRKVVNWYRANVRQKEWYRILTPSSRKIRTHWAGPSFTPEHEVLTLRGKVRVDNLLLGKDRIITSEPRFNRDQLSVILGMLLGDGGLRKQYVGVSLNFSGSEGREGYGEWKYSVLRNTLSMKRKGREYYSACSRELLEIEQKFPRQPACINSDLKLVVTQNVLNCLGALGLAVWYQDDGTLFRGKQCRICCSKLTKEEIIVVETFFRTRYGEGIRFCKKQGSILFTQHASTEFLKDVSPFISPSYAYKSNLPTGGALDKVDVNPAGLYAERVVGVIQDKGQHAGGGVRYCLEVEEANNFVTTVGVVSNCLDVIVPFRAKPFLEAELVRQGTLTYFQTIVMPLVSDTFTHFSYTGLPVDRELFEATRKFMNWAYRELLRDFLGAMAKQADEMVSHVTGIPASVLEVFRINQNLSAKAWVLSQHAEVDEKLLDHWVNVNSFNIRSGPVMTRWLFDVMKFTPVKSTGKPPTMWEKVLTLDPRLQKNFTPAADKETIEILFEQDDSGLLRKLLDLSNVGNICKGFLKEGEYDQDGELVKEAGLGKHIAVDGFLHAMFALTETCRPRAWAPNVLNLSKYLNKYIARALIALLEKVEIPQEFAILFGSEEEREGMSLKELIKERVPSVRSVVKAEEGGCFVESDYKTAEIRGQGFISGDVDLIELMTGTDKAFALYGKNHIRLYYPENTKIAPEHRNPDFLMAHCEEGKILKKLTVDDLEKDSNGGLLHPPYDLHWSLAEELKGMPREVMNSDIDRGMGKEGNFCIAENELVLTKERGLVPIQEIMCCDTLWDNVEWVRHEGITKSGYKEVIYYQGLWATEQHKVWTKESGRTTLGLAKSSSLTLERAEGTPKPSEYPSRYDFSGNFTSDGEENMGGSHQVFGLQCGALEECPECVSGPLHEVSVPTPRHVACSLSRKDRQSVEVTGSQVPCYEPEVQQGYSCVFTPLQRQGDKVLVQGQIRVCGLGTKDVAGGGLLEEGLRQDRQRWSLLSGESETCDSGSEPFKQAEHPTHQYWYCESISGKTSRSSLHREYRVGLITFWFEDTGNTSEREEEFARRATQKRLGMTYDILNSGPRNRFTCSGVIVSNSGAYLITPGTLERRLEAKIGVKPEPGTGQAILDSLEGRQPVSVQYIKDVSQYPKEGKLLQAQSGRIRHFPIHSSEIKGMPWRVAQSILRSMGNEAANFLYQESVAATLARACKWLNDFYLKHNMQARCNMGLYDSCVTYCPDMSERWVVDAAHTLFMDRINIWCYHRRYMSYPIDTDFVYRWSWKPSKVQKAELYDKTFHPMDTEREKFLLGELSKTEKLFFDTQPWILERLNVV